MVAEYPHDLQDFTHGLTYSDGFLYESTDRQGQSSLRKVDLKTGRDNRARLPDTYFRTNRHWCSSMWRGLGNLPESSASLPTALTRREDEVDAVLLVRQ